MNSVNTRATPATSTTSATSPRATSQPTSRSATPRHAATHASQTTRLARRGVKRVKPVMMTVVTAVVAVAVASFVYFRVTEYVNERYRERQAANIEGASGVAVGTVTVSGDELAAANKAAGELIARNYTVLELFYLQGLPHFPGPYNQTPEDGYFEVDSAGVSAEYKAYTSLDACAALVNSTYTPEKAAQILNNPRGYGALYVNKDGKLGVNAKFVRLDDYDTNWADVSYTLSGENVTATDTTLDFTLDITLKKTDGTAYTVRTVLRYDVTGGYRLTELIK